MKKARSYAGLEVGSGAVPAHAGRKITLTRSSTNTTPSAPAPPLGTSFTAGDHREANVESFTRLSYSKDTNPFKIGDQPGPGRIPETNPPFTRTTCELTHPPSLPTRQEIALATLSTLIDIPRDAPVTVAALLGFVLMPWLLVVAGLVPGWRQRRQRVESFGPLSRSEANCPSSYAASVQHDLRDMTTEADGGANILRV